MMLNIQEYVSLTTMECNAIFKTDIFPLVLLKKAVLTSFWSKIDAAHIK